MAVKTTFELAGTDDEACRIVKAQVDELVGLLESLLKPAQEKGYISKDKDPRTLAMFIVSSFSGLSYMHMLHYDRKTIMAMSQHIIDTLQ